MLGDGYRVEVAVEVWRGDDVLLVPASAVFRHGESWAVYRVSGNLAELAVIEIGRRNERQVQVTSGLDSGDPVIVHPSDRITDGVEVVPRRQ